MTPFLQFALALAIIIAAAKAFGYLSNRLGQPAVLGELIAGIILGPTIVNLLNFGYFSNEHSLKDNHKLKTVVASTAYFKEANLAKHAKATAFGCSVDYSAHERGSAREPPMTQAMAKLGKGIRFAGGHVRLGITDWPNELPDFVAVRFLDLLLGTPYGCVYGHENDLRREFYGLPGLYRKPSYGVEYRTLCNYWVNEAKSQTPYTLARLKQIGSVFADFENTSSELIRLYNAVNWQEVQDKMAAGDYGTVFKAISPELLVGGYHLDLGGHMFYILDHRQSKTRNGDRILDPFDKLGGGVPDWSIATHIANLNTEDRILNLGHAAGEQLFDDLLADNPENYRPEEVLELELDDNVRYEIVIYRDGHDATRTYPNLTVIGVRGIHRHFVSEHNAELVDVVRDEAAQRAVLYYVFPEDSQYGDLP